MKIGALFRKAMGLQTFYNVVSITAILLLIVFFIVSRGKRKNKQSPSNLLSIAIVLILVGFMNFGENRFIGNILIGSGVLLSAIFIYINIKKKNE